MIVVSVTTFTSDLSALSPMSKNEKQSGKKQQQTSKSNSQKSSSTSKGKLRPIENNDDVKRDQKLQAVVLIDAFEDSATSLSLDSPKVLLPVVNIPMLDYTFEFLTQNGVEEVFSVICTLISFIIVPADHSVLC